jgi:hypothetical protein
MERGNGNQDVNLATFVFRREASEGQETILGLCMAVVLGKHLLLARFQESDHGQIKRRHLPVTHLKGREQRWGRPIKTTGGKVDCPVS